MFTSISWLNRGMIVSVMIFAFGSNLNARGFYCALHTVSTLEAVAAGGDNSGIEFIAFEDQFIETEPHDEFYLCKDEHECFSLKETKDFASRSFSCIESLCFFPASWKFTFEATTGELNNNELEMSIERLGTRIPYTYIMSMEMSNSKDSTVQSGGFTLIDLDSPNSQMLGIQDNPRLHATCEIYGAE